MNISPNNKSKVFKEFPTRVFELKDYLLKHCVGKENITSFNAMPASIVSQSHSQFKKDIGTIRKNFNLKVCSTSKGYYIPKNEEEESNYLVAQAITHIKTCLSQGVDPRVFYDVLKHTPCNNVQDGQQCLKITKHAQKETRRYAE